MNRIDLYGNAIFRERELELGFNFPLKIGENLPQASCALILEPSSEL